jgi:hypothetical protein
MANVAEENSLQLVDGASPVVRRFAPNSSVGLSQPHLAGRCASKGQLGPADVRHQSDANLTSTDEDVRTSISSAHFKYHSL